MGSYPKSINASSLNDWFNSEKEDPVLIDVREQSELELARFSKEFLHIPISKVTSEYVEEIFSALLDREIVVTCHAGIRSYNFSQWCLIIILWAKYGIWRRVLMDGVDTLTHQYQAND